MSIVKTPLAPGGKRSLPYFRSLRQAWTKGLIYAKSLIFLGLACANCSSYQQFRYVAEEFEIPNQIFPFDYNQTWLATVEVAKKYDLELKNQETGIIKTRWVDNTAEINFSDKFNSSEGIKAAKFKVIINVVKGFRSGKEVSKVSIYRRQMIEKDFLQGWKIVPSDGVIEKTILYRISRQIKIRNKIRELEKQKADEIEASF